MITKQQHNLIQKTLLILARMFTFGTITFFIIMVLITIGEGKGNKLIDNLPEIAFYFGLWISPGLVLYWVRAFVQAGENT